MAQASPMGKTMTNLRGAQPALQNPQAYRLPDIPERYPDDTTSSRQLAKGGNQGRLESYLGDPETPIVSGERYICAVPGGPRRYPDLMVAFNTDPDLYETNNGYVVSLQSKPPDLVLEIASRRTGYVDTGVKVDFYAGLGVREFWRFGETGQFHRTRLAGDRLVDSQYQPITVDELANGELWGYSEALGPYFCWREGRMDWYAPYSEDYIPSQETERQRADTEGQPREQERQRAAAERAARETAEARIRELEARLPHGGSGS